MTSRDDDDLPVKGIAFTIVLFAALLAWVGFWYLAGHTVVTPRGTLPVQPVMDQMAPAPSPVASVLP